MAETPNAQNTAQSPKKTTQKPNAVIEGVSSFLRVFTWLVVGIVFLFVGVICKIKRPIPASWEPFFTQHIPHLPYFVCGFGFFCLAYARGLMRKRYISEQKGDFFYPHSWKVSLLGTQVFLLYATGLYAILFGVNVAPPLGMLGLVLFITGFLFYLLWYQIQYFKNRLPALASLRIAITSFILAGLSFILWSAYQMIIPSLILAFLSVFAGIYSLTYQGTVAQRLNWLKHLIMIVAVAMLGAVGYYLMAVFNPQAEPLDTTVVVKGLRGNITDLTYSPKGDEVGFAQERDQKWYLQFVRPDEKAPVTIKLGELEGPFHVVFTSDGKAVLIDALKGDDRQLVKVDAVTGAQKVLVKSGVEPFSGGVTRMSADHPFLFVTKDKKGYVLNSWMDGKAKISTLYTSASPILSPVWVGDQVVFVDGIHATPYVLTSPKKEAEPILTETENKATDELVETDPLIEVLPSPDNFRYLCVGEKADRTTLWTMLMDGSKRDELYKTNDKLTEISWLADGQKIVFERSGLQLGFRNQTNGIVVLNANLRTFENLVPSQINVHSPAASPDGIKIAFVGSEGLWYPSIDSGVWLAVLR